MILISDYLMSLNGETNFRIIKILIVDGVIQNIAQKYNWIYIEKTVIMRLSLMKFEKILYCKQIDTYDQNYPYLVH